MEQEKLAQLFKKNKEQLYIELQELYLPHDVQKLQNVITSFFDGQLSPSGEYGQHLTQAEMHLLNSCIKIWQTQFKLQKLLLNGNTSMLPVPQKTTKKKHFSKVDSKNAIIGTLIGSGIGAFFNPIVTIAGALTGLCLSIYLTDKLFSGNEIEQDNNEESTLSTERETIDADSIVQIIKEMCENIDNVILTFNDIQVQKKTESVQTECLNTDILETLQQLLGRMDDYENDTIIYNKFLSVEDMLARYGVLIQHYNNSIGDIKLYFDHIENKHVKNIEETLPALVKDNKVIKKGIILTPKKEEL